VADELHPRVVQASSTMSGDVLTRRWTTRFESSSSVLTWPYFGPRIGARRSVRSRIKPLAAGAPRDAGKKRRSSTRAPTGGGGAPRSPRGAPPACTARARRNERPDVLGYARLSGARTLRDDRAH
jgi:hypothetical protein